MPSGIGFFIAHIYDDTMLFVVYRFFHADWRCGRIQFIFKVVNCLLGALDLEILFILKPTASDRCDEK